MAPSGSAETSGPPDQKNKGGSPDGEEDPDAALIQQLMSAGGDAMDVDSSMDQLRHDNIEFAGLPVTVEYKAGSRRTLRNRRGEVVYDKRMRNHYGFIRATVGRDGDEIDVIIGPDQDAEFVYVIDMIDLGPDVAQREDEDKVMLGFADQDAAEEAFLWMYPETFLGGTKEIPLHVFRDRIARTGQIKVSVLDWCKDTFASVFGADVAKFEETKHPRAKSGEHAGEFVSKGGGGSSSNKGSGAKGRHNLSVAPTAAVKPYDESKFRIPTAAEIKRIFSTKANPSSGKIPGGWITGSARVNPDATGDVVAFGTMKKSSKRDYKMSKAWADKNKTFREKNWTKAQRNLGIPVTSRHVLLASDPQADLQAIYVSTTGVEYSKYSEAANKKKAKKKFSDTAALDKSFNSVWNKILKGTKSRDPETKQTAQAVALAAAYGARIGGTSTDDRIMSAKEFVTGALYEIVSPGSTNWKAVGAPSNKIGTQFRATDAGVGTGKAGLLKNWDAEPTTKIARPRGLPAGLGPAIAKVAGGKVIDNAKEYAYIKSNFFQSDIEKEVKQAIKSKAVTAEEADAFLENLEWKTRQWPRWACELDPDELPDFGSAGILTMRAENIQEEDGKTYLRYIGKESKPNSFEVDDPEIKEWLKKAKDEAINKKDHEGFIFPWADQAGANKFSKSVGATKTKDFRTRIGTNRAKEIMVSMPPPKTADEVKKAKLYVGRYVGYRLQNTPSAALQSYVDPRLFAEWDKAAGI